ncbi:MAG: hypothetical protein IK066_09230, partial [Kiritimatiellae bacterium]|nr:hypothetical protein [Kiritimatiellia bacterium]
CSAAPPATEPSATASWTTSWPRLSSPLPDPPPHVPIYRHNFDASALGDADLARPGRARDGGKEAEKWGEVKENVKSRDRGRHPAIPQNGRHEIGQTFYFCFRPSSREKGKKRFDKGSGKG